MTVETKQEIHKWKTILLIIFLVSTCVVIAAEIAPSEYPKNGFYINYLSSSISNTNITNCFFLMGKMVNVNATDCTIFSTIATNCTLTHCLLWNNTLVNTIQINCTILREEAK